MGAYSPPSRATFRQEIAQDIRDTALKTFTPAEVDDFVNAGIAALNECKPIEGTEDFPLTVDDGSGNLVIKTGPYDLNVVDDPFYVEISIPNQGAWSIPPDSGDLGVGAQTRNGWSVFAGKLWLSPYWATWISQVILPTYPDGNTVSAWGYRGRNPLTADADVAEFDFSDEQFVRAYCRMRAFERLGQDRALFQQWQTQANNADVSATQLTGMAQTSESEFHRMQRYMYVIRRSPSNPDG